MATILDGKKLAENIRKRMKRQLSSKEKTPKLIPILIGNNPDSEKYVELKERDCEEVGIDGETKRLPEDVTKQEVLEVINDLNEDESVDGMIVQIPIPDHLDKFEILKSIDPDKDVDGLHPLNIGKLWFDRKRGKPLVPCTPKGIIELLEHYDISLEGKEVTIINRSNLVGKPLTKLIMDKNGTVTICHSGTKDLKKHTLSSDILISAVGRRPDFLITEDMVAENSVVVDVAVNFVDGKMCGDVKFDEVKEKASFITPVPGGVGPMTRVMLLENVIIASGVME